MIESYRYSWKVKLTVIVFFLLTLWCIYLNLNGLQNTFHNYLFGASYGIIALWGGLWGLKIGEKWGGFKSAMGKAIMTLSFGLLFQEFGQIVFSYYNIFLHVEVPYPSLADIGFFGTIPFYIVGIFFLGKTAGIQFSLRKVSSKVQIIIIPLIMLLISYILFLQQYTFDWSQPLKILLDFGYPMGQAIYVSVALLVYSLSQKILGGEMRHKIIFIIIAFIFQYIADYNFLYQLSRSTWENAGYGDYIYLFSYFLMALGIFQLEEAYFKLVRNK